VKVAETPLWTRDFLFVIGVNFLMFCGYGLLPTMLPLYFHDLGAPDLWVGLVAGAWTLASLLMRPIVGRIIDTFGRGGILTLGLVVLGVTSLCFLIFPLPAVLLLIRFVQSLGWAMASTAPPTIAADTVPRARFAEGMSWFTQSNSLAMVMAPWLTLTLYHRTGAVLSLVLSAAFFFCALAGSRFIAPELLVAKRAEKKPLLCARPPAPRPYRLTGLLEKRSFRPALAMTFITAVFGAVVSFVPLAAAERDLGDVQFYFLFEGLAVFCVRPLFGKIVDVKGFRLPSLVGFPCLAAAMLLIGLSTNSVILCVAAVFQGVGYTTCYSILQTMAIADVESERRGSAVATFYFFYDIGVGCGALAAGVVASTFGYTVLYLVWALMPVIAFILVAGRIIRT
jgi:MFS family permease